MPIDFNNYFKELRKRREPTETFWNRKPPMPDFDSEENQGWLQGVLGRLRERFEEKKATLGRVGEYAGALGKAALPQEYGTRSDLLDILSRVQKVPVPEGTELPINIFTALKELEAWEGRRATEGITRYREAGGIGEAPIFSYKGSETWEQRLAKSQEKEKRAKEFEESTFAPKGTTGEYVERLAQGALDIAQFVPGGGIIPGLARAGKAGRLAKGAEEALTAFKVGDKITDGLINAEVIAKGSLKMGRTDVPGFKVKILTGKEAGKESFIGANEAKLITPEVPAVPPVAEGAKVAPVAPEVAAKQQRAMQWVRDEGIADLSGKSIDVNTDGTVTLYHRTSQEAVDQMNKTGKFLSKENTNETFFSNKPAGQAEGYGDTIVTIKVPAQGIRIDDAFQNEIHVAVSNKILNQTNIVPSTAISKAEAVAPVKPVVEAPGTPVYNKSRMLRKANPQELRQEGTLANYNLQAQEEWLGKGTSYARPVPSDGKLTIYRVTPTAESITPGDYVTSSKAYAQKHLKDNLGGKGVINSVEGILDDLVPADGPNEFWYAPKSELEAPKPLAGAEVPPIPPEKPPTAMGAPEILPEAPKPRGKPTPVEPLAATTEGMGLPNQLRVTHREVLADVETVRQSLIGKTDANSRLARMILKDTERQLSKANQALKQMETGQQVSDETITTLKDRIVKNRVLYQASTQGKKELKDTLVDYIKMVLPPTERGKMLASVKNVTTEKGLGKAIDRVNQIAELGEQKGLVSDIYKELSKTKPTKTVTGVLQGKLTPEAQKQLDDIRGMVNTSRAEAQQQIIKNVEAYNNGTMAYDDMIIQNERLRYAGVKEMNAGELQNILEEIQDIRSGARSSRIEEAIADKQRIQDIKDQVKNVVTGGEGLKPGTVSLPPEQLKPKVTWREKITNWQYGWSSLLDKLSKLHKISEPFQSPLSKFGEVVDTARSAQYAGENTALASIHDMLNQVFKPKNRSELNRLLNTQHNEKVALGKFTNAVGESFDLNLTKGEMMSLYNQLKDATLDSTFRNGMKWTDEMMDAVRNGLSAQERAYADGAMEFFNRYYDSINEVYRKVYHMDLPRRDTYFPAFRERDTDIPELIRLMEEANRYNSVAAKSLIARVENIRPLKFLNINDVLMNHITQMEHFKAWAEPMRDIRRVFNDREVRTAIKQYHGDDILKTLEGFINDMARDGVDRAKVNRTVDMLRKNFTLAVLGVKPFIGVKQLPAVFAYAGGMPVKDFTKGVLGFWRNPIRNYRTLVNKSAYFKNRFGEGFERDIKFAMEKGTARRLSNTANFKDYLMTLIRYGDRMAAAPGGWAEYQRVLRTGASEVKALHSAEVVAKRLQATSELETLSAIQRAGSWGKLFTMFQTEPNKYFRLVADNVRNIQYGRGSRASAIKNLIVGWVVLPSVFQWITDGFEVEPTHQARAVVLGPLNNLLVVGGILQSITGWLTDQPYDYQASPVFASMDDLRNAVTKTAKMIQAGFDPTKDVSIDDVIKSIEYYAKFAGEVTGVPTPYAIQVERALREGKPAGLIFPASITKEKESPVIAGLRSEWGEDIGKYLRIPSDPLEIKSKKLVSRRDTRLKDPNLDAKLFVTGQTTSVLTPEAGRKVMEIIQENKIDPETIPGVKRNKELLARQEELGIPNERVTQTEALTTGLTGGAYAPPGGTARRITGLSGRRITRTTMPSPLAGRRARRLAVRKTRRTTMPSPLRR